MADNQPELVKVELSRLQLRITSREDMYTILLLSCKQVNT